MTNSVFTSSLPSWMPTFGQFVAVWEYDGEMWSGTYKVEGGQLFRYEQLTDEYLLDERGWADLRPIVIRPS